MNTKRDVIEYLQSYEDRRASLEGLREKVARLEALLQDPFSGRPTDSTPVKSSGQYDDRLLEYEAELDKTRLLLRLAETEVKRVEDALLGLSEEERLVLDSFYIRRQENYIDRLCETLSCEPSTVYRKKDAALRRLTHRLCGAVIEI